MILIAVSGTAFTIRSRQENTLLFHEGVLLAPSTTLTRSVMASPTKTNANTSTAAAVAMSVESTKRERKGRMARGYRAPAAE